ncbi:MAG: ribonucleoside triphosphate reductase, partial [Candidatus Magasanikbacteria bacterium]|nr:ribonucleoside triphosphate reductase [Candidatus Magasanikbacteria bacterium]
RVGFQTPFTNITMDLAPSKYMADEGVVIGGVVQKETYKDFQPEVDMLNRAFAEVLLEGDAKGRVFTFPIPTYNITKDFDWENPVLDPVWQMTAKYGIPYFSNFINSDMKPEDARSMCCRLRLDNRELRKKGGGLFGANPLTGSIGVVTINLPRIGYLSKSKDELFNRLSRLMDIAKTSLEIKRQAIEKFTEQGLYPYSKHYLATVKERFNQYWKNHFNTIGINGMNEMALNFLGADKNIATPEGQEFAKEVLDFMRQRMGVFQEETNNLYNLEATPAEGTAYRFARKDKEMYPGIICANEESYLKGKADPYYTNSSHLPVGYTNDIFEALKLQDDLQTKYTGGTVLHGFIGEMLPNAEATKQLVRKIAEQFHLPYYTITPTFSVCPKHGYLAGEHQFCPKCDEEIGYAAAVSKKQKVLIN